MGRHVIFSYFDVTGKSLSAYFSSLNVPHKFIRNEEPNFKSIMDWYKNNDDAIIILGNKYIEGISIVKAAQMHILEPSTNLAQDQQLKARVVRLHSHDSGGSVEIITYLATIDSFMINPSVATSSVTQWLKTSSARFYTAVKRSHANNVTPDMIVLQNLKNLGQDTNKIIKVIEKTAIGKGELPRHCLGKNQLCTIAGVGTSLEGTCAKRKRLSIPQRKKSRTRTRTKRKRTNKKSSSIRRSSLRMRKKSKSRR